MIYLIVSISKKLIIRFWLVSVKKKKKNVPLGPCSEILLYF